MRTLAKPEKPVWKRFKVTNATPEKLHEIIQQNPRGAFCAPDELAGLIEQWDAPGHETARGLFLQGFNGKGTYPLDRIIRGTVYVRDLCISVFGGIQPALLVNYLRNLTIDGMISRFQLLVYPDPVTRWE